MLKLNCQLSCIVLSTWTVRKVNANCHISYETNFYSVPYKYINQEVTLQSFDKVIKIYADFEFSSRPLKIEGKGQFSTNNAHYPDYKVQTKTEFQYKCRQKMQEIGVFALEFFDKVFNEQPNHWGKPIYGILRLKDKYGAEATEKAIKRAIAFNSFKYQTVKSILEKGLYDLPSDQFSSLVTKAEDLSDHHLPLSAYEKLFKLKEVR